MSHPPGAVVPRYGLAPPTEDDAILLLARTLGPEGAAAAWRAACQATRVPSSAAMPPEQLLRVAEHLSGHAGVTGVVGSTLAVRARTYLLLSRPRPGNVRTVP